LSKKCEFCGRFFVPDPRVGNRQRACSHPACKKARKRGSQQKWVADNPGYFADRYPYVKEQRQKRHREVIQDEIPPAKPYLKLVLVVPGRNLSVIQDEIILRRVDKTTFAAPGASRRMIQDAMARPL
jgi:hypothetical protein